MRRSYKTALKIAATEAYHSEIVETDMVSLTIGQDQEFESTEQWIHEKMAGWLYSAALEKAKELPF